MESALHLHPRVHSRSPSGLLAIPINPNISRRQMGNARYVSLICGRNYSEVSHLQSCNSLSSATTYARYKPSFRYAILGAGFAGLSVAWHLLKQSSKDFRICIDIYDDAGIGGGASGASGGLLHPYSPKAKLLWRGGECWRECLDLLITANRAVEARASSEIPEDSFSSFTKRIVWKRGIIRPATEKNVEILKEIGTLLNVLYLICLCHLT
ncbi:hypothetical protein Cni_G28194 [Canna indica]|uniref:FAD dependent oxidoreductase domain-containing protein n=1 Tax=Canna indica TaxID=4628 RepID=A0AAQ3QS49_9LILI|nr:hypothetical protein Cni_G28194 [Canna indica]